MATLMQAAKDIPSRNFDSAGFLRKLTAELAAGEVHLPSYPDFAVRVQEVLEDPRAASARIAQVVGADAALAARILRLANSAFLNPAAHQIKDLPRAITQLGRQLVRCTAVSFALQQMQVKGAPQVRRELHDLWQEGVLVASISFVLARETRAASPEEALLTGLLHNIGRLYIAVNAVNAGRAGGAGGVGAAGGEGAAGGAGGESENALGDGSWTQFVAEWHPRMGRAILKQWGFPPAVAAAVGNQNDRNRESDDGALTDILIAATALVPAVLRRKSIDGDTTAGAPFKRLGLDSVECKRLLAESAKQIRELQSTLAG